MRKQKQIQQKKVEADQKKQIKNDRGKLILVIGGTGVGKRTFVKENFGKKSVVVEINNEYADVQCKRFVKTSYDTFLQLIKDENFINTNIVFEEATGFFRGNSSKIIDSILIAKRHLNVNLIFVFHSINKIPPVFSELSNWVILFYTNDEPKKITAKYGVLSKVFHTHIARYGNKKFVNTKFKIS